MNRCRIALAALLLAAGTAGLALAQSSPELEPGVQTSPAAAAAPAHRSEPATVPAGDSSSTRSKPAGAAAPVAPKPVPAAAAQTAEKPAGKSLDHIQLDTTEISGNRELPKVMYVVPWRRADPGEFAGRPPNSLLDEALTPVDRDVFRRQNRYYAALEGSGAATSHSAAGGTPAAAPATRDEK
ncbi:MAG: hypothetical protein WB646_15190 [Steroidobacteraceae bacterium]